LSNLKRIFIFILIWLLSGRNRRRRLAKWRQNGIPKTEAAFSNRKKFSAVIAEEIPMSTFCFFLFVLWISFCFAKLEIAIEGGDGWAKNLPTWRLSGNHVLSRWLFGGREITGYHAWVNLYNFSFAHMAYLFQPFCAATEMRILAFLLLVCVTEDFLWFILNPVFGLRKFKKENIWWHKNNWWRFAPREYFMYVPVALMLYFGAMFLS